ncbi:hypothetical protein E2C01_069029 [Portunus trituberculatus]|uniref:Uncharacterized protein n=1 Tax=Portunus trituberculatus TaxID=210409 RepID=A0A5B7HYA8_PORTR|nr:hypothetical protein [Portunus trituberculatus]
MCRASHVSITATQRRVTPSVPGGVRIRTPGSLRHPAFYQTSKNSARNKVVTLLCRQEELKSGRIILSPFRLLFVVPSRSH